MGWGKERGRIEERRIAEGGGGDFTSDPRRLVNVTKERRIVGRRRGKKEGGGKYIGRKMETRERKFIPEIIIPWAIAFIFQLSTTYRSSTPTFSFIDGRWFAAVSRGDEKNPTNSISDPRMRQDRARKSFIIHLSRILPKGEANL